MNQGKIQSSLGTEGCRPSTIDRFVDASERLSVLENRVRDLSTRISGNEDCSPLPCPNTTPTTSLGYILADYPMLMVDKISSIHCNLDAIETLLFNA